MLKWIRPVYATRRRRWILFLVVGFFVFTLASIELTSRSWFCNSCHIMKPYYLSWQNDPHSDVACVKCHIPPGGANVIHAKLDGLAQVVSDVLNRSSTKPSTAVSDFSCTRAGCHVASRLGKARDGERSYHFDHARHLDMTYLGIAVHCSTCHSFIKEGSTHFEVNTNVCITCHLMDGYAAELAQAPDHAMAINSRNGSGNGAGNGAGNGPRRLIAGEQQVLGTRNGVDLTRRAPSSCDACHTPPEGQFEHNGVLIDHAKYLSYDADCRSCHKGVTAAPPPVDDSRCLSCHTFGMERSPATTEELHQLHVEGRHKVECFNCHGSIQHGTIAEAAMLNEFDCQSCHTGQHQAQRSMYLHAPEVDGVRLERLAVSPMFLTHVPCTGCHVTMDEVRVRPGSGARVARATADSCDSCHRPGLGQMQVPLWQRNTRELYDQVSRLLDQARSHAADSDDPETAQLIGDARQLLDIVRLDGSWGVHNPRYTQSLLERARVNAMRVISDGSAPSRGEVSP
ncbi:MAG: NapC/NirT family cytochrome c [Phycisphaeraceae bacterium]|nr:NapC/NirT family cytochrome c [Phycisphaeraceae bacterium]